MLVTLFGISTLVNPIHLRNAAYPMLFTLFGISTLVKPRQPSNA
ncbi:hypothetical protein FACS1894201_11590 [Bacteroidia bacterium]|nr:hypothetical protein FACS1894201_11590 [Bacteroidia bacterium]